MPYQQTDSDASGQSPVGVGRFEPYTRIQDIQPNWVVDGHGIRGPQQYRPDPVLPPPVVWPTQFDDAQGAGAGAGSGQLVVTDGTTTVKNVTHIKFDGTLFTVTTGPGHGEADVTLKTTVCS